MISVEPSNDLQYIESVLSTEGMAELSGGSLDEAIIHQAVHAPNLAFVTASKDGIRMGFISFKPLSDSIAEVHVALKTRGKDTIQALRQSFDLIKGRGFSTVLAAYHPERRAVTHLADALGFEDIGTTFHNGQILTVRKLTL